MFIALAAAIALYAVDLRLLCEKECYRALTDT
jgi:hypothetical protein